jgi:hypothetical protein
MGSHAILSPSGASRWLACTPSARFELQFPDRAGDAAREGTLAHTLGELLLRQELNLIKPGKFKEAMAMIEKEAFYSPSMLEYCEGYRDYVIETLNTARSHCADPIIFLEQKLDLTEFIPEGFGTSDVEIIADRTLYMIDLKYGKGVPVSAEENKQMMVYALGGLNAFGFLYDIDEVHCTIYQPRIDNISTYTIGVKELQEWAENELKPKAKMAFEGTGDYVAGSHCKFCKAAAVCRENMQRNMDIAKYDFEIPQHLTDEELADIFSKASDLKSWLTTVEEYMLAQATEHGKAFPGFKLVEGRSNRKYVNADLVATKLTEAGYDDEIWKPAELLGITAMEKVLGKVTFNTVLDGLIIKPQGSPTLVPETDKRPAWSTAESAKNDFQ